MNRLSITTRTIITLTMTLMPLVSSPAQPQPTLGGQVRFEGQVVDDQTGQAIRDFEYQIGTIGANGVMGWISPRPTRPPDGRFTAAAGFDAGKQVSLRIMSAGYLPEIAVPVPVIAPAEVRGLVVRMKRGIALPGRLRDHQGNPVAGATIYLAGEQELQIEHGDRDSNRPTLTFRGTSTQTNPQGEFILLGGIDRNGRFRAVAATKEGHVAILPIKPDTTELNISFAEPAKLAVEYNIPGDADATIRVELATWDMPGWEKINVVYTLKASNGKRIEFTTLAPGKYDFARPKPVRTEQLTRINYLDRQAIELSAGESRTISLDRQAGKPLTGQITNFDPNHVSTVLISVRSPGATGDPRGAADSKLGFFDSLTCDLTGNFKTAALLPGEYTLVVHASAITAPGNPNAGRMSGRMLPDYVSTTKFVIPQNGDPEPVKIDLIRRTN